MVENGYVIEDSPTDEEFRIWQKVEKHFQESFVAAWLGYSLAVEEPLAQDEFDELVMRFWKLDFGAEEEQALELEYQELMEERG